MLCCSKVGVQLNMTEEFEAIYASMMGELLDQIRLFAIYYCSTYLTHYNSQIRLFAIYYCSTYLTSCTLCCIYDWFHLCEMIVTVRWCVCIDDHEFSVCSYRRGSSGGRLWSGDMFQLSAWEFWWPLMVRWHVSCWRHTDRLSVSAWSFSMQSCAKISAGTTPTR
jgi:hypothetical protein